MKIVVVFLILLLSACGANVVPVAVTEVVPAIESRMMPMVAEIYEETVMPVVGGTLRLSMRTPVTLNPILNEDATVARVLQLMFEPLVNFDENLQVVPNLASLEFAFNGTNVLVTLRDDVYWSDGTPITSDDIAFTIDTMLNSGENAMFRQNVENFAYYEVVNSREIRIVFHTARGGEMYWFNFPIIPRHHFGVGDVNANMNPVGNGAFMFDSYYHRETMTLVHNPYSFRNRPYIDEVQIIITPDAATDIHAFDRGLVDIFLAEIPEWARHHSVKPVHFFEHLSMRYEFIGFNFNRDLPALPQFRQTLAYAINTETLVSDVFLAHAIATNSPIHPNSWLYDSSVQFFAQDLEQAQTLARETMSLVASQNLWLTNDDGERRPLSILVNQENVERLRIANIITAQLNSLGISTVVESVPFNEYRWRLDVGNFDVFIGGYNLALQPDLRFAFHSESPQNIISYQSQTLDNLLEVAAMSPTDSQFERAISDVQAYLASELPIISLAFRHQAIVANLSLQGNIAPNVYNIFANVEEWFITN
ncbi:MAG: peptide ABC transporter substrate-binding protein [Firmicutes bacterium]|nr:peptide ABC transporter substrate-binding protein [Bacillota bacterium]